MDSINELEELKKQAKEDNIVFHPSIGLEALKLKIEETKVALNKPLSLQEKKAQARLEANELVRVMVTCLDPNKKALQNIPLSISNSYIGSVKKIVMFNKNWHVPRCFLPYLKSATHTVFTRSKDADGMEVTTTNQAPTYNVVELRDISTEEIDSIAAMQQGQK